MATRTITDQQGAALIVALIFLVMLTLLGLAAMGTNRAQQRETYGASEQALAFQAAETGAADGENWIESQVTRPVPDCAHRVPRSPPCPPSTSIWDATTAAPELEVSFDHLKLVTWWADQGRLYGHKYEPGNLGTPIDTLIPPHLPNQPPEITDDQRLPRYVIEHLGKDPTASLVPGTPTYTLWYYRVTARGTGVQIDPPAIVQTVYAKGF